MVKTGLSVTEILQSLVRIHSPSYQEEKIAEWIFDYLQALGLSPELKEKNVSCFIQGKDSSRAIIFNGHTDTVHEGDASLWTHPPYGPDSGVIEDDKLFGLGSSDMKASLAAFIELAEFYSKTPPPIDLYFCFVREEEVTGEGSKIYANDFRARFLPKYKDVICIVGEPTSFDYIEVGNRGVYHFELNISGTARHAAQARGKSDNSTELALTVLNTVQQRAKEWEARYTHPLLGAPAVTVTAMVSSESSPNSVPSSVFLRWDIRTTPGLHEIVKNEMEALLGTYGELRSLRDPCPCAFCPEDSSLVKSLTTAHPKIEQRVARGGNDCGMFIDVGIPAVTFGPGKKEVIHQVNEYAPLSDLRRSRAVYSAVVEEFARKGERL